MTKPIDNPFQINSDRLDKELIEMPSRIREAGIREADARHEHAQAKARLEVKHAQLLLQIRKNPDKFDLRAKPNEAEVEATVVTHPEYERALAEFNLARKLMDLAEADTSAFESMRQSVGRLVDLVQISYFSERPPEASTPEGRRRISEGRSRSVEGDGIDSSQ